jgi:hypothetical protein
MNLRTEKFKLLLHRIKYNHLKYKALNNRRSAPGVVLTLVKMCIIFYGAMPLKGQYLQLKPKQEVEIAGGAQPLGRSDSHLGGAGIGWIGAVSIAAQHGQNL